VKHEAHLNNTQKLSFQLKDNTMRPRYKDQQLNENTKIIVMSENHTKTQVHCVKTSFLRFKQLPLSNKGGTRGGIG
jgi:hypothetical protein